jgi:hypothetical protein
MVYLQVVWIGTVARGEFSFGYTSESGKWAVVTNFSNFIDVSTIRAAFIALESKWIGIFKNLILFACGASGSTSVTL